MAMSSLWDSLSQADLMSRSVRKRERGRDQREDLGLPVLDNFIIGGRN
jgi:hypothetical protein